MTTGRLPLYLLLGVPIEPNFCSYLVKHAQQADTESTTVITATCDEETEDEVNVIYNNTENIMEDLESVRTSGLSPRLWCGN